MQQYKNIPYLYLDTEQSEKRLQAIKNHVADSRLDEETILKLEYNIPSSRILFFDNSDFHYGGQGYESKRASLALEIENKFFNGIMGIGGDFFDNANAVSATNIYGMRVAPSNAMEGAKKMLEQYKGSLSFFLGGNHDSVWGNRNRATNIGPEEELARSLGVPYARYSLVFSLNLLSPENTKVKKMNICLKHEVGNPQKFISYLSTQGIVPDVIIREHTHDGNDGIYMTEVPIYDKNGILKGFENHQVLVMTGKSMQNGNTYYGGQKMFDYRTNVKGLMLSWKKNPYYSSSDISQPKYIPQAVPFDVLHKKENKISMFCEMLLSYYAKPNIEKYKASIQNKSLSKLSKSIDNINQDKAFELLYENIKNDKNSKTQDEENENVK